MKYLKYCFVFLFVMLIIGFTLISQKSETLNVKKTFDYNVYALPIPKQMDFCGESVPLELLDIRERIDRELLVNTYWQSNGLLMFKRAHKFFPIIEPILTSYEIPNDFKYLALIESGLQNVESPAGAKGFWQIMKPTGKEYGLEINSNVDERNNLVLSTKVACKYLLKAKNVLGTWTLAAASYNAGVGGISKELKRQSVNNYYDLLLGQETGRYIFRILAIKEILNNPFEYGFNFKEEDLYKYPETYKVTVDSAITNLVKFSNGFNINYKQLKIYNPWLREGFLNNKSGKKYTFELPYVNSEKFKN